MAEARKSAPGRQPPGAGALASLHAPLAAAITALVHGDHGDPFALLGAHAHDGGAVVRAFLPEAAEAWVVDRRTGQQLAAMTRLHDAGFYAALVAGRRTVDYRLRVRVGDEVSEVEDAYRFPMVLGELDLHLIGEGRHLELYRRLGAHPMAIEGVAGVAFAVWAPNARRVSVVGEFNFWDGRRHPMRNRIEGGVWELFVPGVRKGARYKYEIKAADGALMPLKADPVGFHTERRPATASIVHGLPDHAWGDGEWLRGRAARARRDAPVSIYECHLGSWMRVPEEGNRWLSYGELAERLIPYVKELGFTHLELLPVSEHPFDGSWGYQPAGLYAPTSRFGAPEDFAALVDACHRAGLGVILDWVPGHFPTDPHGLGAFDGSHLYEHADPRQGFQLDWNTLLYNYGRREVANYLLANGLFWTDIYHCDGLRVDAVASMLYLDYSRRPGEWVPNIHGGRENLAAIEFVKQTNAAIAARAPGVVTVAEESTAWPGVTHAQDSGGLGFSYKWNMGWMHDTLSYVARDPAYRKYHHHDLTFGLLYAFSEDFVLPLSHDEVVHGKGSLLGRMPGDRWQKFANLRAYLGFMFAHPGKKLLFMGGEFGQEREWDHDSSLDWHLLDDPLHKGVQRLVRDLNHAYRSLPALHQLDGDSAGFEWLVGDDADNSVLAFLRRGREATAPVLAACNFTPVPRFGYRIGVPAAGVWTEVVNTDAEAYGGGNLGNLGAAVTEAVPAHGRAQSLSLTLPPLAALILVQRPG